ncbi:hypothetical protein H5410_002373 [Solanum commersonii]|uniref:Uncharacterized protein n=1 Tax=Solanum commersonii TaxID=4109 RepID=A0A9J6B1V8_SOLCO|nr:hypothetical protein H5410_002373 [Solanum commersonii]
MDCLMHTCVWTYEFASQLNPRNSSKKECHPRICNWRVVALKPKFEMLMTSIFQENACSNIVPTSEELATFDLAKMNMILLLHYHTFVNPKIVQSNDIR